MGRKKNPETPVRMIFSLPESVAGKLMLLCRNPLTGRGYLDERSQSKLVERLLREHFAKIEKNHEG